MFGSAPSSATGATPPPNSVQYAVSRCPTGQIQLYDPVGSIISADNQIHNAIPCTSSGFTAYVSGTTPDGPFEGWNSCSYNPESTGAFYNELATETSPMGGTTWLNTGSSNDWLTLDFYNTQAQTLLNQSPWDRCYGSIPFWWNAIHDRFSAATLGNPNIRRWTELSCT